MMNNKNISLQVTEFVANLLFNSNDNCHWFKLIKNSKNKFYYEIDHGTIIIEYILDSKLNLEIMTPKLYSKESVFKIYLQNTYNRLENPIYEFEFINTEQKIHFIENKTDMEVLYLGIYLGKLETMPVSLHIYKK